MLIPDSRFLIPYLIMDILFYENNAHTRGYTIVAGIDEAGRGPLAGPVVAACVVIPDGFEPGIITDSKKLTEKRREECFERISAECAVGVGIVGPDVIDEINILQATYKAMRAAAENCPICPDFLLIDGNPAADMGIPAMSIVKGDAKSLSIGAASIIAKVTRDRIMTEADKEYPEYGFAKHKGYGTAAHLRALERCGACPIHRMSFAPVREVTLQCKLTELR